MGEPLKILVIEDRPADFLMLERHLRVKGLPASLCRVDSAEKLQEALRAQGWDVVLTDFNVPSLDFR